MTFENVIKKTLTDRESSVRGRGNLETARAFPDDVKSGNAKLRAIYE